MRATHEFEELLMNAAAGPHDDPLGDGKVILGPSTSVLMEHLASSFVASGELGADDEVGAERFHVYVGLVWAWMTGNVYHTS